MTKEPDWKSVKERLGALTLKELKPIKSWFNGSLGGASAKTEVVSTMATQMKSWWNASWDKEHLGRKRVESVLKDLEAIEGAKKGESIG